MDAQFGLVFQVCNALVQSEAFIHLFSLSCVVYSCFYDKFDNCYISGMYQRDKYGVVINYAVISVIAIIRPISVVLAMVRNFATEFISKTCD